jgi:hypothetical protein
MGLTWQPWNNVSEGSSTPGAPITAVPWGNTFAVFLADPGGGVYAIKAVPGFGWKLVPGRTTTPGAPITALASGNHFTLFMADANGEVFTTSGIPYQSWQPWTSVSQGSTTPGAPITAVPWGNTFALFLADPGGGVYAIKTVPGFGWELVPGRSTKPGGHITAVASGNRFTLFMADTNGEVFTTSGVPYEGWDPWTSVSQGSTLPGAPVAAIRWGDSFVLFLADPGGGAYAIKAVPGYGWEPVPGRTTAPGARVTAMPWYQPPKDSIQRFLLLMADVHGEISATSGIPYQGWDPWTSLSESSTPGAPVAVVPDRQGFALFIADDTGEIQETSTSSPPATPGNLHVTSVTSQTIGVAWTESNPASVELDGFDLYITRMPNGGTQRTVHSPADRSATYTGLASGVEYQIRVDAFNSNGYSASSASVVATTTPMAPPPASLSAGITNINFGNFGVLIHGSNFGKNEQVLINVEWTAGPGSPALFQLTQTTDDVSGAFSITFTGVVSEGLCPISVPPGDPQPPQTFQVTAKGLTSGKTASANAGPFTCP